MSSSDDPLLAVMREVGKAPALDPATLRARFTAGLAIGRFELVREIGRGGFGVVWEARDTDLERSVAIKALQGTRLTAADAAAFRREARVVAKLAHPNIITLHDVLVHDDSPALVLELLDGETLEATLAAGPLSLEATLELGRALAIGLAHAHDAGVTHGDLKPSNVFCTRAGGAKILDFGLAGLVAEPGKRAGTPGYMAPEQWRGAPVPASDLFALGVVLHRALSGSLPFGTGSLAAHVTLAAPLAPEHAPASLAALVGQLLAIEPGERPASAASVATALADIADIVRGRADPTRSPYRFLDAFGETDHAWFFGRDRETHALDRLLAERGLVAVVGASGAGKSSLIFSGVVAPLAARGWTIVRVRGGDAASPIVIDGNDQTLVVVDQLEEVFTQTSDPQTRKDFLQSVLACADRKHVRVVVAIREDFLSRLSELPALRDRVADGMMLLGPPDREALEEIVRAPAKRLGIHIDDDVVAALVDGTAAELAPLPLLQVAASRLWHRRDRDSSRIDRSALDALGGIGGVLATHADEVLRQLNGAGELDAARTVLCLLVTAERTRQARSRDEMLAVSPGAERVLDVLVAGRLLAVSTRNGVRMVELAHDSLITRWSTLSMWLDDDREMARMRDRVAAAAAHWHERGQPAELLWSGATLAEASFVLRDHEIVPRDRAFLDAARRRAAGRDRRRRFALIATGLALAAVSVGALVQLRASRQAAVEAHRRALVQTAAAARDPLIASLLLRELPARQWPDIAIPLAIDLTHRAIPYARSTDHDGELAQLAWNGRGDALASAGEDGVLVISRAGVTTSTLQLGSAVTTLVADDDHIVLGCVDGRVLVTSFAGKPPRELLHGAPVESLALTSRGLIVETDDGKLSIVDLATGHAVPLDAPVAGPATELSVSPDRNHVAYGAEDNLVVIDLATAQSRVLRGHADTVYAVTFLDDHHVASASADRTVRVWPDSGDASILSGHSATVYGIAALGDGRHLASIAHDGSVRLWDVEHANVERVIPLAADPTRVTFSPDARWLAVGDRDGSTVLVAVDHNEPPTTLVGDTMITRLAFSRDGGQLATAGADGTLRSWRVAAPDSGVLRGHSHIVGDVAFTPSGTELLTASVDGTVKRWRIADGKMTATLAQDGSATAIALTGSSMIVTSSSALHWSDDTHSERLAIDSPICAAASNGRVVIGTATGALVRIADGQQSVLVASGMAIGTVDIASDGTIAAGDESGTIRIWPRGESRMRIVKPPMSRLAKLALAPDGSQLVTIGGGELIWWSSTGELVARRETHSAIALAVSPDRTVAVSAGNRVVLIREGMADLELHGHAGEVTALAFNADGSLLASGSNDRSARIWKLAPSALADELARATTACLTARERQQYLGEPVNDARRTADACASQTRAR